MSAAVSCHAPGRRLAWLGALVAVLMVTMNSAPASASGPEGVVVTRDLPYGSGEGAALLLDVYQPPAAVSPSPVVILIHGGGWTSGDKDRYASFSRALAVAGFVAFDINYSLDPNGSPAFPRQVTDVKTALTWVQGHAEEFGGDTGRIAVAGGSAGGYLAAMLGTQVNTSRATPLRAVVSLSGPMDLVALVADLRRAATAASGQCLPVNCATVAQASQSLRSLLGCEPLQCSEQILREASPITYASSASPPFFLANGTQENVPATQATRMAAALRSHHVPVEVELVPGDRHSVDYVPSVSTSLLNFLTKHVDGRAPADESTVTDESRNGHSRWVSARWLVATTALFVLTVMLVIRRRTR